MADVVQRKEGIKEEAADRPRETRSEDREPCWGRGGAIAVTEKGSVFRIRVSRRE